MQYTIEGTISINCFGIQDIEDGFEMRVVFWNSAATHFSELLLDCVFTFIGGTLSGADVRYNRYANSKTHVWKVEPHGALVTFALEW